MKNVRSDVYKNLQMPGWALGVDEASLIYENLCSYNHKPLPHESLTHIRGTNLPSKSESALQAWFWSVYAVCTVVLDLLIAQSPMCLFPVTLHTKFGFNPPVCVYFDRCNFIPIRRSLGEWTARYKEFYRSHQQVKDLLDFYSQRSDVPLEDVVRSWNEQEPEGERSDETLEMKIEARLLLLKARIRAFNWAFAYGKDIEIPGSHKLADGLRKTVVQ